MGLKILDTCTGCGSCELVCEEVFELDEDGMAHVKPCDYKKHQNEVNDAIYACPVDAIVEEKKEN